MGRPTVADHQSAKNVRSVQREIGDEWMLILTKWGGGVHMPPSPCASVALAMEANLECAPVSPPDTDSSPPKK